MASVQDWRETLYYCSHTLQLYEDSPQKRIYFRLEKHRINPFSFARGRWLIRVDVWGDKSKGKGFKTVGQSGAPAVPVEWPVPGLVVLVCKRAVQGKNVPEHRVLAYVESWTLKQGNSTTTRQEGPSIRQVQHPEFVPLDNPSDADIEIDIVDVEGRPVPLDTSVFQASKYRLMVTLKQVKA